jgi:hypothetical protein
MEKKVVVCITCKKETKATVKCGHGDTYAKCDQCQDKGDQHICRVCWYSYSQCPKGTDDTCCYCQQDPTGKLAMDALDQLIQKTAEEEGWWTTFQEN